MVDIFVHPQTFDVIFVGLGPANMCAAYALARAGTKTFCILEAGKKSADRIHNDPRDSAEGEGGAALESDGKFSTWPAGTAAYNRPDEHVLPAYDQVRALLSKYEDIGPLPCKEIRDLHKPEELSTMTLKPYDVAYLSLPQRKELVSHMLSVIGEQRVWHNCKVTRIFKKEGGYHVHVVSTSGGLVVTGRCVVCAGGRFFPLVIKNMFDVPVPMEFKRSEVGMRIEGPSSHPLFSISKQTDPKFVLRSTTSGPVTMTDRTFCWCRDGEVTETACQAGSEEGQPPIRTWSGRSDGDKTGRSNFGYMTTFKSDDPEIQAEIQEMVAMNLRLAPPSKTTVKDLQALPVWDFLKDTGVSFEDTSELTVYGPCIEGVGHYPKTDMFGKVESQQIYFLGDCAGKSRGIIPAMMDGFITAEYILSQ